MSMRVISVLLVNAVTHGRGGRPDIKHGTTDEQLTRIRMFSELDGIQNT